MESVVKERFHRRQFYIMVHCCALSAVALLTSLWFAPVEATGSQVVALVLGSILLCAVCIITFFAATYSYGEWHDITLKNLSEAGRKISGD